MATIVRTAGYDVLLADGGDEALAICESPANSIDLMISDVGLPGMNGRQLVDEALRLKPGLKVIIASGYSTEAGAGGRPGDEGLVHLTKPYDLGQLRRALGV